MSASSDIIEHLWQQLSQAPHFSHQVDLLGEAHLRRACAVSNYLAKALSRDWDVLSAAFTPAGLYPESCLEEPLQAGPLREYCANIVQACSSETAAHKALRHLRKALHSRLLWRDLVLQVGLDATLSEQTLLAEVLIDQALSWHGQQLQRIHGCPRDSQGAELAMVVIGMGKLGAGELNVSSDIDLIFAYRAGGQTDGARPLDHQSYFVRLGQKLIAALDKVSAEGFVFRVDMRLRPHGSSGPLALSFAAMSDYYQAHGRDWERYALIKARPVAGDLAAGASLMHELQGFVYRRYLDFGAIEALRDLKTRISREVLRKGMEQNIKLGQGGIRELEFIVQAFQLIHGGRIPSLRVRHFQKALAAVHEQGWIPDSAYQELRQAYGFLRHLEHAIQGLDDRQTQQLPAQPEDQERIAVALQREDWAAVRVELEHCRKRVSWHFEQVIAGRRDVAQPASGKAEIWAPIWRQELDVQPLLEAGLNDAETLLEQVRTLRQSAKVRHLQSESRQRLDQFMPALIERIVRRNLCAQTQKRLFTLVEAVLRRSAYLLLLIENPRALDAVLDLFDQSDFIAGEIARTPLLLDQVLQEESLYLPPEPAGLRDDLRQSLNRIPQDDLEQQMEALRHFKSSQVLRAAASELRGTLALMKVSDTLSYIAEAILEESIDVAWHGLTQQYGRPVDASGERLETGFGCIGYGKLGGLELSYHSDLDLVFLHAALPDAPTDGSRPIDGQVFYTRLSQRLIHLLGTRTASGVLYEVDMRLRPSGNSGLMVSSLSSFLRYQRQDAWTWEHQALLRARFIAGDSRIRGAFEEIRQGVLCQPRDPQKLRAEVIDMREKMRAALAGKGRRQGEVDLKQDPGGIVDIEFMVQYWALRWASEYPAIIRWSDNIRILESLAEAQRIPAAHASELCDIYRQLRARGHRLALQNKPARVPLAALAEERATVTALWQSYMQT